MATKKKSLCFLIFFISALVIFKPFVSSKNVKVTQERSTTPTLAPPVQKVCVDFSFQVYVISNSFPKKKMFTVYYT